MPVTFAIVLAVAAWIAVVVTVDRVVAPRLARHCGGDPLFGLARVIVGLYCRAVHRLRADGAEEFRSRDRLGPLLVVANHTAGIDPLLVQSQCTFFIRWMMADDMMSPAFDDLWRWLDVIPVRRDRGDSTSLRTALRHLEAGGVLGLFPEGGITRPSGRLAPFMAGVGMLAARSQAPILLVWIGGTPETPTAFGSLVRPSRSRLRFERLDPFPRSMGAAEIATALRARLAEMSGWPLTETRVERDFAEARKSPASPGRRAEVR